MKNNKVSQINEVFLATILVYIIGSFLLEYLRQEIGITLPVYVKLVYSQMILILPSIVYLAVKRINPLEFIRFKKVNFATVVMLVLFGMFIRPFMTLLNAISMVFVENHIANTATTLMNEVNLGLALVFIAVIPSIFEEVVYRGVFYNQYRKVNTRNAVILSGFLFGVMHMNLNQFIYAFFMGVMFALIIEATDSILASIIVHFTINGSSLLFLKITPWLQEQAGASGSTLLDSAEISKQEIMALLPSLIVPAFMSLGISLLLYYGIAAYNNRASNVREIFIKKEEGKQRESLITFPLLAGLSICLFLMIYNELF